MTLLSICTNAANNVGVAAPGSIFGNNDPGARRLLQMARRTGISLMKRANWTALTVEHVFVANGTSSYTLPADFRSLINDTMWDRTRFWKMRGAMSPQQWQLYKSSIIGRATIERRWRLRLPSGDAAGATVDFQIDPDVGTADHTSIFVYEYVSNSWARSATNKSIISVTPAASGSGYLLGDTLPLQGGTSTVGAQVLVTKVSEGVPLLNDQRQQLYADDGVTPLYTVQPGGILEAEVIVAGVYSVLPGSPCAVSGGTGLDATFLFSSAGAGQSDWAADSDFSVLDEDLIELGVTWRLLARLGMSYAEERDEYDREVDKAVARDGGTMTLDLAPYDRLTLISPYNNMVDGNFPAG